MDHFGAADAPRQHSMKFPKARTIVPWTPWIILATSIFWVKAETWRIWCKMMGKGCKIQSCRNGVVLIFVGMAGIIKLCNGESSSQHWDCRIKAPPQITQVYSTCSLHRLENEDVVEAALGSSGGKFQVVQTLPWWRNAPGDATAEQSGPSWSRLCLRSEPGGVPCCCPHGKLFGNIFDVQLEAPLPFKTTQVFFVSLKRKDNPENCRNIQGYHRCRGFFLCRLDRTKPVLGGEDGALTPRKRRLLDGMRCWMGLLGFRDVQP